MNFPSVVGVVGGCLVRNGGGAFTLDVRGQAAAQQRPLLHNCNHHLPAKCDGGHGVENLIKSVFLTHPLRFRFEMLPLHYKNALCALASAAEDGTAYVEDEMDASVPIK